MMEFDNANQNTGCHHVVLFTVTHNWAQREKKIQQTAEVKAMGW